LLAPLLIVCVAVLLFSNHASAPSNRNNETSESSDMATESKKTSSFNKTLHDINDPTSPWIIVNKLRPIASSYIPDDLTTTHIGSTLRAEAATALNKLVDSAHSTDLNLYIISGYR